MIITQHYVAEAPCHFRCWPSRPRHRSLRKEFATKEARNVVRRSPAFIHQEWRDFTITRATLEPLTWSIKAARVYLRDTDTGHPTDRTYWLIVAWDRAASGGGEYKYFLSNAPPATAPATLLHVAFQRARVEHLFRVAQSEIGLDHYEGRTYHGLMRHLILCQMLLFLAEATDRLRGGKSAADPGTDRPGPERPVPPLA